MLKRTPMEITHWARKIMDQHGLIEKGWKFAINGRTTRTLGTCNYETKMIQMSKKHLMEDIYEDVVDTLLHEIAHALVGVGHGHDKIWQQMAITIGARPHLSKTVRKDHNLVDCEQVKYCIFFRDEYMGTVDKSYYDDVQSGKRNLDTLYITGKKKQTKGQLKLRAMTYKELAEINVK